MKAGTNEADGKKLSSLPSLCQSYSSIFDFVRGCKVEPKPKPRASVALCVISPRNIHP